MGKPKLFSMQLLINTARTENSNIHRSKKNGAMNTLPTFSNYELQR